MGLDGYQCQSFFMFAQRTCLLEFVVDHFIFGYGTISCANHTHWLSSTAKFKWLNNRFERSNNTNSFDDVSAHSFSHLQVDIPVLHLCIAFVTLGPHPLWYYTYVRLILWAAKCGNGKAWNKYSYMLAALDDFLILSRSHLLLPVILWLETG